jgi:hypothetical protein
LARNFAPFTLLYRLMVEEITGCDGSAHPVATFADGAANMRVLDAIRASSAQGGIPVAL